MLDGIGYSLIIRSGAEPQFPSLERCLPQVYEIAVAVGELPVLLRTTHDDFRRMLEERYAGYLVAPSPAQFRFDVEIESGDEPQRDPDADVEVGFSDGHWQMRRGDFFAEWEPQTRSGTIQQTANPYAIDSVLRIVHSLLLVEQDGFLLHAASAIRNGRAHIFTGKSGAGKTTITRFAPSDAILLTDEVSYIRKTAAGYRAYGTPFAGELAKAGENVSAAIEAVYVLVQSQKNEVQPICAADALRTLMGNVLFFAEDEANVARVFANVSEFLERVPVHRMLFRREAAAWELTLLQAARSGV